MKKILLMTGLFLSSMMGFVKAQGPPPPGGNSIFIDSSPNDVCTGSEFQVQFTTSGTFNAGNVFAVYISDANGIFGLNPLVIGVFPSLNSGSATCVVPDSIFGTGRNIMVVSTDPIVSSSFATLDVNLSPPATITASGPLTFCEPGSVTLDASAGDSYLWSTGETTSSITISETTPGVSVRVFYQNGCASISQTIDVVSNTTPDRPQITASGPLCSGSTITLSTDQASDVVWSTGETTQSIDISSGSTYEVTYTDANGCSNTNSLEVLEVTPPATPNLGGPYSQCGGTVLLDAGATGTAVVYDWSNGESTQTINVSSTNIYSVVLTNAEGCTSAGSAEVSILSLPNATITNSLGSTPLCTGNTATLSVPNQAAVAYVWSNNASTNSITISAGGNYSVLVTGANGCSASQSINVSEVICVPATKLRTQDCGLLTFNLSSSIIADLVNNATQYEFEFRNASGTTLIATALNPTRTLVLNTVSPAIQWSTQYQVRVRAYVGTTAGPFGQTCTIGTIANPNGVVPNTQLRAFDCGNASLSLASSIQAVAVTGATKYEFQFSVGSTVVSTKLQTSLQCNLGSMNPALSWGTTYSVRVRAYIGTTQGNYGTACNITICPDPNIFGVPTTKLVTASCGRLNFNRSTGQCQADAVTGANFYIFEFLQNNVLIASRTSSNRNCVFNAVSPALSSLQTYQCRVKAVIAGVTGNPGAVCTIGFVSGSRYEDPSEEMMTEGELAGPVLEVTPMPNPFQGQTMIQVKAQSENLQLRIYDLGGKLVSDERINGTNQYFVGGSLRKGVYILEVSDTFGNISRQKLIKSEE